MAKKPLNIVDEMFAGESKEARQAYDDMVAKFRIKNPDYPIPDQEAIYHKNLIHQQLAFPHLPQQKPNFGAQTKFLLDDSDICIFGGAAGGGKSHAGLLYPLMYIHLPIFGAVMLRREMPDITNVGGLLDESKKIYPLNGGMLTNRPPKWIFPSGARIDLSGLQYDSDADAFKGSQIGLVYFDEVDLFTEYQFWLLFSRARPPKEGLLSNSQHHPFNPMLRGSTNPDPDSFIRHLLDFWIGKDGYAIPERSGMKRWLVMNPDTNVREQFTIREEAMERIAKIYPTWEEWERPDPTSLSFIPSALKDNPFNDSDKDYRSKLGVLDAVKMERFLRGNWNVKYAAGKLFQPDWCEFIELADVPADVTEVRGWDIASTEPTKKNKTPDFTSGTKMARDKGGDTCYILDNVTFQLEPNDGKKRIDEIARADGKFCRQDIPLDPGSGKWTYDTLRELIPEAIPMDCSPEKGNKPDRFAPFSAHCYRGADHGDSWVDKDGITRRHVPIKKVKIVKAPWNAEFINQLKEFPDGKNDDVADSCSRAFNNLFNDGEFDVDSWFG